MDDVQPKLLVFTTLFPHPGQPKAGLFIRERMFRVAKELPLVVVAPVPWFPLQGIIRKWRPHFRPPAPRFEIQEDIEVYHPRFFSMPGLFKSLDGFFMALGSLATLRKLRHRFGFNIIDAHFAYPDGYAATLLGKWLRRPVTITLRGTEVPLAKLPGRRRRMIQAMKNADRIFSVSESLRQHAIALGIDPDKIRVVGNGVDTEKFRPVPRPEARAQLGIEQDAPVLISVGALVERKGFHRVIERLPALCQRFPGLRYLIVGGSSPEGDWTEQLNRLVAELGLEETVCFLGALPPEALKLPLSAADVFVLSTRNEGWANVFLEAMACGLPVVTTDVGGNAEVVAHEGLGTIVPFGDRERLEQALIDALDKAWDRSVILDYARANAWERRVAVLTEEFGRLVNSGYSHFGKE
ncbi:glycosyl transferase family 1 [Candidatus Tenderia electrophaga]|jgi:glycosyltransferase involved in cell wall biosynthesis|uniref:Glycosyl transferase family 1 n=1 Tax=Candidatus Tenderia electrophaga TaxID=1748243 RepID=A0A0S2TG20_9GAMM|nr:glycosyl transferase family 1 [Candidatus Tenderia electrophaga]